MRQLAHRENRLQDLHMGRPDRLIITTEVRRSISQATAFFRATDKEKPYWLVL